MKLKGDIGRKGGAGQGSSVPAFVRHAVPVGLYLILLTPIFVWSGFLHPYVTTKTLAFQFLVEVVCAAVLAWSFLDSDARARKTRILIAPLFLSLAGFFLFSIVTAAAGVDWNRSLWGFIDRQDGLVFQAHMIAWMAGAAWYFRRAAKAEKSVGPLGKLLPNCRGASAYLFFSFCVSVAVALTVLVDPEVWAGGLLHVPVALLTSNARPGGAFGNPTMLGPYLLFHVFYGIYFLWTGVKRMSGAAPLASGAELFWDQARPVIRYGLLGAVVAGELVMVTVILAGQTRGVLLGLAGGIAVVGLLLAAAPSSSRLQRAAGASMVLVLVLAAAGVWHYRNTGLVSGIPVLNRTMQTAGEADKSGSVRLFAWEAALRALGDHPILGWGVNNIYYALNKYYDPRLIQANPTMQVPSDTWLDKSHNFLIDLLVERGIPGVLIYLFLLVVVAMHLRRFPDKPLALCLSGGIAAYLISILVAFDVFGSLFGFYLSLIVLLSLSEFEAPGWLRTRLAIADGASRPGNKKHMQAPLRSRAKAVMVAVALLAGLYYQAEIGLAIHGYQRAKAAFLQDPGEGVALYDEAFTHTSPYHARQKIDCAYLIVNSVINKRPSSRSFDAGPLVLRLTAEALAAHPEDVDYYIALNDMYNGLALYGNRGLAADAEAYGRKALELSPKRQEAIFQLGRTYIIKNQAARAVELNRRMLQDADFPLGHWLLGLSLLQDNQREEAKQEILKAVKSGYQLSARDRETLTQQLGAKGLAEITAGR